MRIINVTAIFLIFSGLFFFNLSARVESSPQSGTWPVVASLLMQNDNPEEKCGEKVRPPEFYSRISLFSLVGGFGLIFIGILMDNKRLKYGVFGLALVPFGVWLYINFLVDYDRIKRLTFNYNAAAENTLANIAEAEDRYKSEHDTYLKDLEKLYSHMAGSHGANECVKILKIEADWNHWSAVAKHVSSPDEVTWDSRTGSSLKKG